MVANDTYLFDPQVIQNLDWSLVGKDCDLKLSEKGLKLRPLRIDDFDHGHLDVLSQLSVVGTISRKDYEERFQLMKSSQLMRIIILEDLNTNQVAASATLLFEPKFTHECAWVGHVQDVVVDGKYRGQGLGKALVLCLKLLVLHQGAYKMDLDCADDKISFYKSLGFTQESGRANYLTCRFEKKNQNLTVL
ncbi:glucosamine 6-phosphate N-acetyltransferase [Brevipalpus obovatus]|uniref:glucosamine 6-phosphate N-acetyltransferase n=1 Tax=Brevipalpus obovatus TaxID=246614 RepID=UPI003D9EF2BD